MPETRPAAHQAHLHPDRAVPKFGTLRSQNFYPEIVFCVPHQNCHWGIPQFHGLKQIHFETKLLSRTCNAINAQEGQLQSSRTLNHETCNFCCQKKKQNTGKARPQGPVHPPGWTIGAHWDLLGWCPCFKALGLENKSESSATRQSAHQTIRKELRNKSCPDLGGQTNDTHLTEMNASTSCFAFTGFFPFLHGSKSLAVWNLQETPKRKRSNLRL